MPRTYRKSSPARFGALTVLEEVLTHGKTLLDGLPLLEPACPDPRDLALAREIVSGTCRWLGRVRYVLRHYAARLDQFPPIVQRILELSVYQLLFLDRVPPYAVLSDAVELARERKVPGLAAAVNAILRKVVGERSHNRVDSTGFDPSAFSKRSILSSLAGETVAGNLAGRDGGSLAASITPGAAFPPGGGVWRPPCRNCGDGIAR